jgi:methylglyoxal synthase/DNA-binding transcriptional regulator LsrR (DeoR family)
LRKFEICATAGTAHSILGTGLYENDEISRYRSGRDGGVVELAAIVARRECEAVIFLSDPKDLRSDVPENYALRRVCKELRVRLITTLASAEQWGQNEANGYLTTEKLRMRGDTQLESGYGPWAPMNWRGGETNNGGETELPVDRQTLALIAHDGRKEEMVVCANRHANFLKQFDRVLTTGTTGFLMKLLHANDEQAPQVRSEANRKLGPERFYDLEFTYWYLRILYSEHSKRSELLEQAKTIGSDRYDKLQQKLKEKHNYPCGQQQLEGLPNPDFVNKIMPLPSGPKGGDILIAEQVLKHFCHAVVFFQDPGTAHPHDPDIRLFERTCQFWSDSKEVKPVYATCVTDPESTDSWAGCMSKAEPGLNLANKLRRLLRDKGLRDVVIVDVDEQGGKQDVGMRLARACAAYFNRSLVTTARDGKTTRVVLASGQMIKEVLEQLTELHKGEFLQRRQMLPGDVIWSPQFGHSGGVTSAVEASILTDQYRRHFGGKVEAFKHGAIISEDSPTCLPEDDEKLLINLRSANLVLITVAPWDKDATLYKNKALNPELLPEFGKDRAVMGVVFLNPDGSEERGKFSVVGLGCDGLRQVSENETVMLLCGGNDRHEAALCALKAGFVSVFITTRQTAAWVVSSLEQDQKQAA